MGTCKVSLAGKKYGILQEKNEFGTKKKMCEACVNKRNEQITKQSVGKVNKRNVKGSNLREQMRQFQHGGISKTSKQQNGKKDDEILKPSIAKIRKKSNSNLVEAVKAGSPKFKKKKV